MKRFSLSDVAGFFITVLLTAAAYTAGSLPFLKKYFDSNTSFHPGFFWLAGLVFFLSVAIVVYMFRYIRLRLSAVNKFLDNIEGDKLPPANARLLKGKWNQTIQRLNRLNERFYRSSDTLKMLFSVSRALTSHLEITEIFSIVMDIIKKRFDGVSCAVIMFDEDGFFKVRSQHGLSPEMVKSLHFKPGEGLAGEAARKCHTIAIDDTSSGESSMELDRARQEGAASVIYIPLIADNKSSGLLYVNSRDKEFFTPDRIEAVSNLAGYLSIAIRNAQLYERVRELNQRLETEVSSTTAELTQTNSRLIQKVREMKVLSDIAAYAAAKSNLSEILEMIVEKIKDIINAQTAGFFLYSAETNELMPHSPFFGIRDREFAGFRLRADDKNVLDSVIKDGRRYIFNDAKEAVNVMPFIANQLAVNSLALVPLRSAAKPIGILGVANKFGSAFNRDDMRILDLIADKISGIIDNVRLYQEIELRLHDMTALQEISSAISSEPVLEKTINKIILSTTKAFNADLCALLLHDEGANELVTQPGAYFTGDDESVLLKVPANDPNSLSASVFRSGEPFLSPDASIDPRVKSSTARLWDMRSLILVPLKAENKVIGVLRIGRHQANSYNKDQLKLASLIAHQSAIIIENAHLYDYLKEAKLEQERLNQVKNEFLSVVSHELRTPVTAIKGFVKLVLQGDAGKLNSQQERFLQIADQSTDRLTLLISDLLDISKIESGQMSIVVKPLILQPFIEQIVRNINPEVVKKNLKLETKIDEKLPPIMADSERLIQVFDNLIINAVKFTPSGGTIIVSASDKGDCVIFSVKDTGIGIAVKDRQKIFEKFFQVNSGTTRATAGAGLGLAIVKSIVEMHGGQIWVESEPGRGSDFKFFIPRAKTEIKDFRQDE